MRYLTGEEEKNAQEYMNTAAKIALSGTCERSLCGAVIVKEKIIIGQGFNSPPRELESQRKCSIKKNMYDQKVTDKTCCMHAEQRAIIDALKNNPSQIIGSTLYFIHLSNEKERVPAKKPYCTICSKLALDVGISEFVLSTQNGICVYDTEEYNLISFEYKEE
ncbi:MAG: hypothetical protein ACP5N2_00785 [Candidatus Nanoarchaeia archaeon]